MSRATASGFTLVELTVVITMLAILAWVAWPSLASLGEIRLDAASRRVANDLRYAQNRAIGTRTAHGVRFDVGAGRYVVYAGHSDSALVDPADRGATLDVVLDARAETRGVSIASASFGSTPAVAYDSYGVPRDTAGVDLTTAGRVVLAYRGLRDTVEVAPQTGAVSIR